MTEPTVHTASVAADRVKFGLRARLLLSFVGISGFAVAAAIFANYAFFAIGKSLQDVTERTVPPAIATLELSQRTERIVAAGPALLAAATTEEEQSITRALQREVQQAAQIISRLPTQGITTGKLDELRGLVGRLDQNILSIDSTVEKRIAASDEKKTFIADTFDAYGKFRAIWTPQFLQLRNRISELQKGLARSSSATTDRAAVNQLNTSINELTPLEQIQNEAAVAFEVLVRAANAPDVKSLDSYRIEASRSLQRIDSLFSDIDPDVSLALITPLSHLRKNLIGSSSIISLRQSELDNIHEGQRLTVENTTIAKKLSNVVESLVVESQNAIAAATARTQETQQLGRVGLLAIVALSLISSVAIVWLYVGGVVARLSKLADGMLAIVKGRRDIDIPAGGSDEITGMARAVEVFRNNAIALDGLLAEREQAAARLEQKVAERTAALSKSLTDLRTAQDRLVQTEKLASLGQLTAGIAHEIKNPLNFVTNFSVVSTELIDELQEALKDVSLNGNRRNEINELMDTLRHNLDKVVQHGKRADAIVKNMLLHSRQGSGAHRPVDINAVVEESLNLAYHGVRAEKQGFNITLERSLDPTAGEVDLFPQEITRVLLNLISNGFYAAAKRKAETNGTDYEPILAATTKNLGDRVEIRIRDNGTGISAEVKEKMFNPFFTTKPAGEGTGLGLSLSHDIIVKQHNGSIEVDTRLGEFTEFRIVLPRAAASIAVSGARP